MAKKKGFLSKFSRQETAKCLIFRSNCSAASLEEHKMEGDFIDDGMKNRKWVRQHTPIEVNVEKKLPVGKYYMYVMSDDMGSTCSISHPDADKLVATTDSRRVWNVVENNLLHSLTDLKPKTMTLIMVLIVGVLMGICLKSMF